MTQHIVSEYVKGQHKRLGKLLGDYRSRADAMNPVETRKDLDVLFAELQEHIFCEENVFFPLYEKTVQSQLAAIRTRQLRREHESMRELVSMISQKQDQGATTVEEQEAFHVLFINHTKNEEDLVGVLDQFLTEKEKQAALGAAARLP